MKSNVKWALWCALTLSLTSCATGSGTRYAERAKLCRQTEAIIPDAPDGLTELPAYVIRLLGVIEQDRTAWGIERACVADL